MVIPALLSGLDAICLPGVPACTARRIPCSGMSSRKRANIREDGHQGRWKSFWCILRIAARILGKIVCWSPWCKPLGSPRPPYGFFYQFPINYAGRILCKRLPSACGAVGMRCCASPAGAREAPAPLPLLGACPVVPFFFFVALRVFQVNKLRIQEPQPPQQFFRLGMTRDLR